MHLKLISITFIATIFWFPLFARGAHSTYTSADFERDFWEDYYLYKTQKRALATMFMKQYGRLNGADSSWRREGFKSSDQMSHDEDVGHGFWYN